MITVKTSIYDDVLCKFYNMLSWCLFVVLIVLFVYGYTDYAFPLDTTNNCKL